MNTKLKSTCCDAPVKVEGIGDFGEHDVSTCINVCTKCGKPCDVEYDYNELDYEPYDNYGDSI